MAKYYAVKKGRKTGVFSTWEECQSMVNGFKGAVYKSFPTFNEAQAYLDEQPQSFDGYGLIAYVDGSYNQKTKEYGYGCILIEGQKSDFESQW